MFSLEDFLKMKEDNEQVIKANDDIICEKQKANFDLKAENRVIDKLIAIASVNQKTQEENVENI